MPKNGRRKRSSRGPRGGTVVTSLSASQAWDRRLASAKDTCRINDRIALGAITTNTGGSYSYFNILAPASNSGTAIGVGLFGQRVFSIGVNFYRYRINRLLACYRPIVGTGTAGLTAVGFADDSEYDTNRQTPNTVALVQELRCSHSTSVYREIEVDWKPVDPKTWYYVQAVESNSASDYRFESPGALVFAAAYAPASTVIGQIDLYYDITFEGSDVATSGAP